MLLTPQHRRSSRVSRRAATKTAQQIFDENIAKYSHFVTSYMF